MKGSRELSRLMERPDADHGDGYANASLSCAPNKGEDLSSYDWEMGKGRGRTDASVIRQALESRALYSATSCVTPAGRGPSRSPFLHL